jgi:CspA family cold shock protein
LKETGTVKWFNDTRGFGFIEREELDDLFVHYSDIKQVGNGRRTLHDGQLVEFEVGRGPKGPIALNVEAK